MKWQINKKAVYQILKAATDWNNLAHLEPNNLNSETAPHQDPREVVSFRATKALEAINLSLPLDEKRKLLKQKAQDIVFVIKSIIGQNGERVGTLRKYVADDDIWVLSSMDQLLDLSHPTFNSKKGDVFFAPEIGKFQGFSYLNNFRRKHLLKPVLQE